MTYGKDSRQFYRSLALFPHLTFALNYTSQRYFQFAGKITAHFKCIFKMRINKEAEMRKQTIYENKELIADN